MALQGYGTELGLAAVIMILVKDVIAPLIKRIPIFGSNSRGGSKDLEKKVDKLKDTVNDPERIPGKAESCQDQEKAIVRVETCMGENIKRFDRFEEKLETNFATVINLIKNGGK